MEILHETRDSNKKSILSHVFDSSETGIATVLNDLQYTFCAVFLVVILNKCVQKFIPDADDEKSSLEIFAEVFFQLILMIGGIIIIHRIITYIPTYSGFKYETLSLTNVIIAFLIIVLSIQTKLGIKINVLWDRLVELWNGPGDNKKDKVRNGVRVNKQASKHSPSQADYLDSSMVQGGTFPPAPVVTSRQTVGDGGFHDHMMGGGPSSSYGLLSGPAPANSMINFGSLF
jgi:hypothetical protein